MEKIERLNTIVHIKYTTVEIKESDLDELEWTVERQNTKIATLEELVNELSNKKDKLLEILTLAVCNFGTSYYGKIYNMAVKIIQKENRDKTWEEIKAEVKQTDKPTPQQVAWVFKMICENGKIAGSFRDLIYDKMEYSPYDYEMLYQAGGMAITNAMYNEFANENNSFNR